jgi:hypothetical protein
VRATLVSTTVLAAVLGACGVGERPTLVDPSALGGLARTPTGVDAADEVLGLLEGDLPEEVTATYTITPKLGALSRPATVVRSGDQTSVTIGDVRFLSNGEARTCQLATGTCVDGIDEAEVSDTAVTSGFYNSSPAQVLRVSLARATGEPVASSQTVGEHPVTCVTVPAGQGEELTCATPEGLVAVWDTAFVHVTLDGLTPTADPAAFGPTR